MIYLHVIALYIIRSNMLAVLARWTRDIVLLLGFFPGW